MAKDDGARPAPARRARSSEDSPRSAGRERTNGGPEGGPSAAEGRGPVAAADGLAPVGAAEGAGLAGAAGVRTPPAGPAVVRPLPDGPADGDGLTHRQRRVLEVIRDSVERRGYPPSMREIGEAVGLTSPSSGAHQLTTLERKGFLRRDPNRPRAIEVILPEELRREAGAV